MSRTLTADPGPPTRAVVDDDPGYLRGPVLRAVLPLLAVLLVVLAGVLTLAALGVAITPVATLLAVGGYALLTAAGAILWVRRHPVSVRPAITWRTAVGGLVTAVVLVGAVAVAVALQPTTSERFVSLQGTTSAFYTDGALTVPASGQVDLGWQLRGFGVELAADPVVSVTVDGAVPAGLSLVADADPAPEGTGFTSGVAGGVTFTAPAATGRHPVVVTVADAADPVGSQQLILQLVVTA
jgi:hypothetical protein